MSVVSEHVYKEAIRLSPIDRAELIEKLFESFSTSQNTEIELNWKKEVADRRIAYDSGKIPADSMKNVFKRLSKR